MVSWICWLALCLVAAASRGLISDQVGLVGAVGLNSVPSRPPLGDLGDLVELLAWTLGLAGLVGLNSWISWSCVVVPSLVEGGSEGGCSTDQLL